VTINVIGDNEFGLLSLISSTIKEFNINIVNANFETKENRFVGKLVLQVSDTNLLDLLLKKLSSLKGIAEVKGQATMYSSQLSEAAKEMLKTMNVTVEQTLSEEAFYGIESLA
jgi:uncharacterized protein with ACT and thioredoxin-like domain